MRTTVCSVSGIDWGSVGLFQTRVPPVYRSGPYGRLGESEGGRFLEVALFVCRADTRRRSVVRYDVLHGQTSLGTKEAGGYSAAGVKLIIYTASYSWYEDAGRVAQRSSRLAGVCQFRRSHRHIKWPLKVLRWRRGVREPLKPERKARERLA